MQVCAVAARVISAVVIQQQSLNAALDEQRGSLSQFGDRALLQELCYGVLRWRWQLEFVLRRLVTKPLRKADWDVVALILVGLYQLQHMRVPAHVAVSRTVAATQDLGKGWSRSLLNAVLRSFQRERAALLEGVEKNAESHWSHPDWLIQTLQADWPDAWQEVLQANNQRPPMTLRVNQQRTSRDDLLARFADAGVTAVAVAAVPTALILERPANVDALPGFGEGWFSVQDAAAQLAAEWLNVEPGQRVLDACAAPGGKTCHVLERYPGIGELVAVDDDAQRNELIKQNLHRLGLSARVMTADVTELEAWWDGQLFDRILLDGPCTATGVIRRHPDIKSLRRQEDVAVLAAQQARMLAKLWPLLRPGGILLYVTCSILRDENDRQLAAFLAATKEARELPLPTHVGRERLGGPLVGRQILTGDDNMDGFYYARMAKLA